jgi:tetratricopeptide (TPR) repeat protein
MEAKSKTSLLTRQPVILAALVTIAIAGFLGVDQLVKLYRTRVIKMSEYAYQLGLTAQNAGKLKLAVQDFRTALTYDPDNDQYQLSLGRALRDSGHFEEAESYLLSLWQRDPEDSTINLALARLAVRQEDLNEGLRYYHNSIYGVWKSDPETNRRMARFELIEFLLQKNSYQQAQAELIGLLTALPKDPAPHERAAELLLRAQDPTRALAEFQVVLQKDHHNPAALFGAGQAAYELGRYRTAQIYLQGALAYQNDRAAPLLQTATTVLQADPFRRGISDTERNVRIQVAFAQAGRRLDSCLPPPEPDQPPASLRPQLAELRDKWKKMERKVARMDDESGSDFQDAVMDLVFQIEQETQSECGPPQALDQALLAISRDPTGVDR